MVVDAPPEVAGGANRGEVPSWVYVAGEFKYPGRYIWTNGMTLHDGIAIAGGFTKFAPPRIRLERWDGSVESYKWRAGQPLTNNPVLRPGDKLINPRY